MSALKGKKKIWQESTKDNSLFLSTAVQLNSESLATIFSAIGINLHLFLLKVPSFHQKFLLPLLFP
jgi:hypothetical protein